jgi:[ribosomal protein S5]-alanine N-acetyltransferase
MPNPIETSRLKLVPATVEHLRAEIGDRIAFSSLIDAVVPQEWPPETTVDALPLFLQWLEAAPDSAGWYGWYGLAQNESKEGLTLIGGAGFLGPPEKGVVNLGYSVLPRFQGQGFATEMAARLIQWAFEDPAIIRIGAETEWANPASVRVLTKLGFLPSAQGAGLGAQHFQLLRSH